MRRGEIRWYKFARPDKRRPVLLLSRDFVTERLREIVVVPATRTTRGLATEVVLSQEDGMPTSCALNFDHLGLVDRKNLGDLVSALPEHRWDDVERALLVACGFPGPRP
jgi:mRNA interferase MazF